MPTFQGATIQEAIDEGLAALSLTREQVSIEVLQEGKHGLFGLGKKPAVVNLTPKAIPADDVVATTTTETEVASVVAPAAVEQPKSKRDDQTAIAMVHSYLEDICAALDLHDTTIESTRRGDTLWIALHTDREAFLIGKHGKIINALQYLVQTVFNHYGKSQWTVMLNVGDYRERRQQAVTRLAERSAREVLATGKPVYLDPMPAFERKAIHHALADHAYAKTRSVGVDPKRYVVIDARR